MSAGKKFFITLIFVVGAVVAWYVWSHPSTLEFVDKTVSQPKSVVATHVYKNEKYGFSFSYTDPYVVSEINGEQVFVGKQNLKNFEPVAFIYLVKNLPETQIQSFEEFVLDQSRLVCSSQTTTESVLCTRIDDVVKIAPFTSVDGARGQVFYLKGELTNNSNGKVSTIRRGPFYTFNTSANTPNLMSFIMIGNPIGKTAEAANTAVIKAIADSLKIVAPK